MKPLSHIAGGSRTPAIPTCSQGPTACRMAGQIARAFRTVLFILCAIGFLTAVLPAAATEPPAATKDSTGTVSPQLELISFLVAAGTEALAHERYGEAQERFAAALQLDWNQPRAFSLLQRARAARQAALSRWEGEARRAEARRDFSAAATVYGKILTEDSSRHDLGSALVRAQNRDRAAQCVRSGLEKFIADDFTGAQLDFERALAICPDDTVASGYRHRAMQNVVQGAGLAEVRSDSAAWTMYLEALQRFRDGDLAAAEKLWNDVLARYPGNAQVRLNLDQVRRRLGAERVVATE